jgi:cobaltochelatase CobS
MTSSTVSEAQVNGNGSEPLLDALGTRWAAGAGITELAAEAGMPWQRLHGELTRRGFRPATPAPARRRAGTSAKALMRREVRKAVRRALGKAAPVEGVLEVRWPDDSVSRVSGRAHAEFPWALQLAVCRKNILLVGPAGSGKTHLAAQVAKAMGLPFAFVSCTAGMSEGQLLGRLLPTGDAGRFEYVRSDFIRCYEEGGMFLFDEIDAADPNTLLIVNAALANGHVALPNRPDNPLARRHPDFVAVAAANTYGTGADRQYVGRNQLDESTLDRFRIGQVEMDYDPEVEKELCPDDALRQRLLGYRARVREAKLRRVVSTRFLRDAFDMKRVGASDEQIDAALFRGWSTDEVAKVRGR